MTTFRILIVVLVALVGALTVRAAPAPLPKPHAAGPTVEQIAAELRQRGYHVYEVKRADAPGYWEITVRIVRNADDRETDELLTQQIPVSGNDRDALLAYQARTQAPRPRVLPHHLRGYRGPAFNKP